MMMMMTLPLRVQLPGWRRCECRMKRENWPKKGYLISFFTYKFIKLALYNMVIDCVSSTHEKDKVVLKALQYKCYEMLIFLFIIESIPICVSLFENICVFIANSFPHDLKTTETHAS